MTTEQMDAIEDGRRWRLEYGPDREGCMLRVDKPTRLGVEVYGQALIGYSDGAMRWVADGGESLRLEVRLDIGKTAAPKKAM